MERRDLLRLGVLSLGNVALGCGDEGPLGGTPRFRHGVASADPQADSLLLWTRVTDAVDGEAVTLEVSDAPTFESLISQATVEARASHDYCVHVEVDGLEADQTYYYRFVAAGGELSEVGMARTAPTSGRVRLAFTCCGSYAHGYFHTYRRIAERDDLHAVVHLGDYIYEYGNGGYGDLRDLDPPHTVVTLEDYQRRYAYYRREPDLAVLHRAHAMIVTWDDHEFANNAWPGGSIEHDPERLGPWMDRVTAAEEASRQWLARREVEAGSVYRKLSFGDVDLFVLDTRIEGRDAPPTSDLEAAAPDRTILGERQRERFLSELSSSTATWKVVAHAVQLSPHHQGFWNLDAWDGYSADRDRVLATIEEESIEGVLFVCGDGHKSFADDLPRNPFEGYDPMTGEGSVAVEVMTPAASSPNLFGEDARMFEELVMESSPHTHFVEAESRGYWVLDLDEDRATFELCFVGGIEDPDGGTEEVAARFDVDRGTRHLRRSS